MTLIQIRIPHAAAPLSRLGALLKKRLVRQISRKAFLVAWSKARKELATTPEYHAFRTEVCLRDDYKCVVCYRPSAMVHHKKPVSRFLHLALVVENGEVRCLDCHKAKHPHMQQRSA